MSNQLPLSVAFELAPLTGVDPAVVVAKSGRDEVGAFILSCAHMFNDLKDLMLLGLAVKSSPPKAADISPQTGQWHGLRNHIDRMIMSVLHETLVAFKAQATIADGLVIAGYLEGSPSNIQGAWKTLVDTAMNKASRQADPAFKSTIEKIRNSVSYHYYQPRKLQQAYREHFFSTPIGPYNEFAYLSLGNNMEKSRFYFADAASERAVALFAQEMTDDAFSESLRKFAGAVNEALMYVIRRHIQRPTQPVAR